ILVDEFQDTNEEQYKLIKHLCSIKKSIFAVGDPDQTIYTWRGARPELITEFPKVFKGTNTYILDDNYRSTQETLNAANNLIKNNKKRIDKNLKSYRGGGLKPIYFHADSQDGESRWVVNKILKLTEDNVDPNEICILYRANYLSRNIEQELITNNIKYQIYGGIKFYQRKEIKDLISYLKALFVGDELSIRRIINVPKRNIGPASIETISDYATLNKITFLEALYKFTDIDGLTKSAQNGILEFIKLLSSIDINRSLRNIFDELLEKIKYEEYLISIEEKNKMENVNELRSAITKYELDNPESSNLDYLQEMSLYTDSNAKEFKGINLMTIHTAKGLEFNYVFMIGMNEGIFPSRLSIETNDNLEEERRIAYVGITRAKNQLFLSSYSGTNFITKTSNVKSRFIDEIITSNNIIHETISFRKINDTSNHWFDSSKPKINIQENYNTENAPKFRIGDWISHTKFGNGQVLAVNEMELSVMFKSPYNRKTVLSNHKAIKRASN
ncbi:MAG: ATP-dependent helicase, partial [Mycoplasma sp.]